MPTLSPVVQDEQESSQEKHDDTRAKEGENQGIDKLLLLLPVWGLRDQTAWCES